MQEDPRANIPMRDIRMRSLISVSACLHEQHDDRDASAHFEEFATYMIIHDASRCPRRDCTTIESSEKGHGDDERHTPEREQRVVQLGVVWMEVLRPYARAMYQERESGHEKKMQQDDTWGKG